MATAWFIKPSANALKIVLVGDSEVGKTWLLSLSHELYATLTSDGCSFCKKPFVPSEMYSPTVFKTYVTNVDTEFLGNYQTNIWETGGCGIFNSVRPLGYIGADAFMLCFDVTNRESFYNITDRWLPEVHKYQPDIPVVLVGTKCDLRKNESPESNNLVSVSEAETVAQKMDSLYYETSALTGEHVAKAFECAVKLGHTNRVNKNGRQLWRRSARFDHFDSSWLPPISSPPECRIEPSTYMSDFKKALEDVANADVLFRFEDGSQSISAHRIVLWLSVSAFRDVVCENCDMSILETHKDSFEVTEMAPDSNNDVYSKTCSQVRTCVVLKNWISRETFMKILEFLYTGVAGISRESEHDKIKELLTVAKKLQVCALVDICNDLLKLKGDDKKNSNHTEKKIIEPPSTPPPPPTDLFLYKEATMFCDVTFVVEDKLVFAHKAVLVARSPVFAALLSENFRDGKSSQIPLHGVDCRSFLAVLEYLYTDYCSSLEKIPVENVLVLADRLCLPRLVQICEVQMHKGVQQMTQTQASRHIAKDLLNILTFSKMFNAKQLTEWCLYVIALNLSSFQGIGKELDSVEKENKQFFEEHRWPPQEYLTVLEKYKRSSVKRIATNERQLHWKANSCLPHKCNIM